MSDERQVRAPWDGTPVGTVRTYGPEHVPAVVAAARRALDGWRAAAPWARADALRAGADAVRAHAEELAALHARESGKVLAQARHEVLGAARLLERNAELGRAWAGTLAPTGAVPGGERDLTLVERVPVGVVAAVVPFNFPVELTMEKAAAALATGNVVVVKPPPQNPLATLAVVRLLNEAGLPEGVLQALPGGTATSAALCAHPGVDAVSLTGSVGAGRAVAAATAHLLRPLHLELGGNGAAIVLPDADLDLVVAEAVRGRLLMNGQACAATKRLLVHRDVADEVTERLVAALADVVPADPSGEDAVLGPLVDAPAAARVAEQVGRVVAQGGRLALGSTAPDGARLGPVVLAGVPAGADVVADDEVFGPVLPVVPVDGVDDAVAVANLTSLRLTAAVFTADLPLALDVACRLDFGGVVVNGTNNYRPPVVPFGGVGLAGAGREGLGYTAEELTRTRFVALRGVRPAGVPLGVSGGTGEPLDGTGAP